MRKQEIQSQAGGHSLPASFSQSRRSSPRQGATAFQQVFLKVKNPKVWAGGWLPPSPLHAASWLGIWIPCKRPQTSQGQGSLGLGWLPPSRLKSKGFALADAAAGPCWPCESFKSQKPKGLGLGLAAAFALGPKGVLREGPSQPSRQSLPGGPSRQNLPGRGLPGRSFLGRSFLEGLPGRGLPGRGRGLARAWQAGGRGLPGRAFLAGAQAGASGASQTGASQPGLGRRGGLPGRASQAGASRQGLPEAGASQTNPPQAGVSQAGASQAGASQEPPRQGPPRQGPPRQGPPRQAGASRQEVAMFYPKVWGILF